MNKRPPAHAAGGGQSPARPPGKGEGKGLETQKKLERLRRYLQENGIPAAVISRQPNFSWLTGGGRGFIGLASEAACGRLVVTADRAVLVANNIEAGRLAAEELPAGLFASEIVPWAQDGEIPAVIRGLCPDGYRADAELEPFFLSQRTVLCPEEAGRFRLLGREVDRAMWEAARGASCGMSEFEMAGRLSAALWSRGIEPITLLIAADGRSRRVRHYVPTGALARQGFLCSVCARRGGLVASATRILAFRPDFAQEYERLLEVEAAAIGATVPGRTMGEVFRIIAAAYEKAGFPREIRRHHQGGLTGYQPREIRADAETAHEICAGEAYAWNPSCEGAKCEDTLLVTAEGAEILTAGGGWPSRLVAGRERPAVLRLYG